jgi:hypothetical protein
MRAGRAISLLLVVGGCGWTADWGAPSSGGLFPHPEGYPAHGADWLDKGAGACTDCHGTDRAAPTCADCHPDYPHAEGWSHSAELAGAAAVPEPCGACHDAAGSRAAEQGCTDCHATWPHPAGWAGAGHHGQAARDRGSAVAACGSCHGQDHTSAAPADWAGAAGCGDCHLPWPHPADIAEGAVHGALWAASLGGGPGCGDCHDTTPDQAALGTAALHGGTAGVACARCHATFPHPVDWARSHSATAARLGEPTCLGCHAAGDGPALQTARCAPACHGGGE